MLYLLLITTTVFAKSNYPTSHWREDFLTHEQWRSIEKTLDKDYLILKSREELRRQNAIFFSFLHQNLVKESRNELKKESIHEIINWPDNLDYLEIYMQQIEKEK